MLHWLSSLPAALLTGWMDRLITNLQDHVAVHGPKNSRQQMSKWYETHSFPYLRMILPLLPLLALDVFRSACRLIDTGWVGGGGRSVLFVRGSLFLWSNGVRFLGIGAFRKLTENNPWALLCFCPAASSPPSCASQILQLMDEWIPGPGTWSAQRTKRVFGNYSKHPSSLSTEFPGCCLFWLTAVY